MRGHPRRRVGERVPLLVVSLAGLILVIGALAATSDTETSVPEWYHPDTLGDASGPPTSGVRAGAERAPQRHQREPQGADTPDAPDSGGSSLPASVPDSVTTQPGRPSAPAWRTPPGMEERAGSLADVAVVRTGAEVTFVAAGADERGPVVLAAGGDDAWRELVRDGLPSDGFARAVAATPTSIVIAGNGGDRAGIWELTDRSWRAVPLEGSDRGAIVLADVAIGSDVQVAVGYDGGGAGIWARRHGIDRFMPVELTDVEDAVAGDTLVRDVVATAEGFSAVGQVASEAIRWSSPDGLTWAAQPLTEGTPATPLALSDDARVVAGYDGDGGVIWVEGDREPHVVRLPAPASAPQRVEAVAVRDGLVVAAGRDGADARCWQFRLTDLDVQPCGDSAPSGPDVTISAIAGYHAGFIAVGATGRPGDGSRSRAGIWVQVIE